jgi:hypothetical protein
LSVGQIVDFFQRGITLQAIADKAGVTRERIRQIVAKFGCEPRQALRTRRKAERHRIIQKRLEEDRKRRAAESVERRKRRMQWLKNMADKLQVLWVNNATFEEMAAGVGVKLSSLGWYMKDIREKIDPSYFPKRDVRRLRAEKRNWQETADVVLRWWNEGVKVSEIGKRLGISSPGRLMEKVRTLRTLLPRPCKGRGRPRRHVASVTGGTQAGVLMAYGTAIGSGRLA